MYINKTELVVFSYARVRVKLWPLIQYSPYASTQPPSLSIRHLHPLADQSKKSLQHTKKKRIQELLLLYDYGESSAVCVCVLDACGARGGVVCEHTSCARNRAQSGRSCVRCVKWSATMRATQRHDDRRRKRYRESLRMRIRY